MAGFVETLALLTVDENGIPLRLEQEVFDCAWAGAALLDLAFAGRIDTDLDGLHVIDRAPTGAPGVDRVLNQIAERGAGVDTRGWVRELSGAEAVAIRDGALAMLAGRGVLAARAGGRRYRWLEAEERLAAQRRLAATLQGDDIPDPWDVALVALLDAADLLPDILPAKALENADWRLAQLRGLDLIGREVAGAIADIERSIILAVYARAARFRRLLLHLGVASATGCLAILLLPRIGVADRFGPTLRERLWFDSGWQEWSGYALLAGSILALLAAAFFRRRSGARAARGHGWRLAHVGVGACCLALLVAHTGLRLGANANAALMVCYLLALLLGALAGVATYGAPRLRRFGVSPRLRGAVLRGHFLTLLPLPALLAVHVLLVYAY